MSSKNENIRDLYRGINESKKGHQPSKGWKWWSACKPLHHPEQMEEPLLSAIECTWGQQWQAERNVHSWATSIWTQLFQGRKYYCKLKRNKLPGTDQILSEMIQAGGNRLCSEIHKTINFTWNKVKVPQQWKESTPVPIYKNGDKTNSSNYRGTWLPPTTYKIPSNILVSRPTTDIGETIGSHQCGPQSTTYQAICIHEILQKKNGSTMWQHISYL